VDEAGFVLIDVLSNDTDAEGNIDPTTVAIVGTPANGGTAVDAVTGEVTYTHDGSETLSDSFTYTVNDLSPGWTSNAATVSITVNAVNDPPVAVADAYATDADTQLSVSLPGVLATDTDAEGGPLTAVLDTDMSYGTLSFNADGSFTYDPTPGFNGESSFTYYANDGTVNSAAPATVTITVGTSCGSGVDIIGGDWTMISLPCDPGIFNQVGDLYGDELGISAYGNGNEWLMYDYNPSTNSYGLLGISSQLKQDMGYWILSDNSAHLDIEGNLTPIVSSTVCDDIDTNVFIEGCIEVYLTPPPPGTPLRWNLVGNPFPYPIAWKDVRILVDVEVLNATEAQGSGYGQKNIQIYENGSTYSPYDDQTPGMEGVLNPGQAFWYAATDDTVYNIRLLFPAKPHTTGMTLPSAPDYRLFAGAWTVLREVADFVVPSAHADKPPDKGKPPKDDNPGHQRREARLQGREWYVRLIAEWPEGGLKDRGNVLGQLADSELGFDAHDLQEMSPFSTPYLTIVFPHDDWGEKSGNYASDYHPLSKGKSRGDAWQFEVRTDQPGREITLRWVMQGEYPQEPLLINVETGETVAVDPAVPGSYTFVMDGTTQRFEWMY
jgi:VCBS repeat-containing protein